MNTKTKLRIEAVKAYLNGISSLRMTAAKFGISYLTLWRWVRWYKNGGEEALDREKIFKPWNSLTPEIEKRIALMKERLPSITISQTEAELKNQGTFISKKTIWKVWKKYGLINTIPDLRNPVLFPKPDSFLDERILKLYELTGLLGRLDFADYYKRIRELRIQLKRNGFIYTSIKAKMLEAIALSWMGKAKDCHNILDSIREGLPKRGDPLLKFNVYIGLALTNARMLKIREAMRFIPICRHLCKILKIPNLYREIANLYIHTGYQNRALKIIEGLLKENSKVLTEEGIQILNADRAILLASAGDYDGCLRSLKNIRKETFYRSFLYPLIRAQCALGRGKIYEGLELARDALLKAEKSELLNCLHVASLIIAACYMALGERKNAREMIKKYNSILKRSRMEKDVLVRKLLFSRSIEDKGAEHPVVKLVLLLNNAYISKRWSDYTHVYEFADRYKLLGLFHRFIFFYPELIIKFIQNGKKTFLPRSILALPVFNTKAIVYKVDFLGKIKIYCPKPLNIKLTPKEASFFIFLATQKPHSIPLSLIYEKFLYKTKTPARALSHLLWQLKKKLQIPSNMLYMRGNSLICRCHFLTDWDMFERRIAQAQALKRLGDLKLVKKEYQKAISLFRGEIFKNMYDKFAVEKRDEILLKYEETLRQLNELDGNF